MSTQPTDNPLTRAATQIDAAMKTDNKTLVLALRILANDIQSDDGVANACIAEAANRIEELVQQLSAQP